MTNARSGARGEKGGGKGGRESARRRLPLALFAGSWGVAVPGPIRRHDQEEGKKKEKGENGRRA